MQTPLWVCANGTTIRLSQMSTEHIVNVLRYLHVGDGELGPMARTGCSGFSNGEWVQMLGAELSRRG